MASSLLAIRKQLECSICREIFNTPKILESCNHVFCKKCLSDLAKSKGGSLFPCPHCRKECKLPNGGVDGLKDDLISKNLICILAASDLEPTNTEEAALCSICHVLEVKSVCDFCELDLCSNCRKGHLDETNKTGDHIVYDLCLKHKRRKKHYCCKCDVVICVQCLKTDHSEKDHGTNMYQHFAADQVKCLEKHSDQISDTVKSMVNRIAKADEHFAHAKGKGGSKKRTILDESFAAIIQPLTCKIYDVKQEIKKLQIRLGKLQKEEKMHWVNIEAKMTEIDIHVDALQVEPYKITVSGVIDELNTTKGRLKELKEHHWLGVGHHQQIVTCRSSIVLIESILLDLEDSMDKIDLVWQYSEGAELIVSPDEQICQFSEDEEPVCQFLEDAGLGVTPDEPVCQFSEDEEPVCQFSEDEELIVTPDEPVCQFSEDAELNVIPDGSSTVERDSSLALLAEAAERIAENSSYAWSYPKDLPRSKSKLLREWNFETNGPACIYSVVCLPEGFVILGGTSDKHPTKIFWFPSMEVNDFKEFTQGVTLSKDLAANSNGDLVLLRGDKPHLRLYSSASKYKWFDNIPSLVALTRPRTLTCAGKEIIVLDGFHPNVTIFVFTIKGEVLHTLRSSYHGRLAYSPFNQMVYVSFPGSEVFKLSESELSPTEKILELPRCIQVRDICCGADGNIVAAGMLEHKLSGYSFEGIHRVLVCSLIHGIVDTGEAVFVHEDVDRIRMDVKQNVLIIGCGAKLLFYQMI